MDPTCHSQNVVANRVTSQSDRKRKTIKESVSLWGVANRVTSQSDRKDKVDEYLNAFWKRRRQQGDFSI